MQEALEISKDFKWMMTFMVYFIMVTHVVACIWIISAKMDPDPNAWISSYRDEQEQFTVEERKIYMTAFYFTVTTITTVGYGDMSASTFLEQIICIFIMIAGVIGFSLASGALTNYISNQDSNSEEHDMRMAILDGLLDDFDIEHNLYAAIRKNIQNSEVSEAAAR